LRVVGGGAVLDVVVQDDAVIVVGDLRLVTELDRAVDAALADRPGVGVMQADQPGGAFWGLPGQPGPGLSHDRAGALDGGRQLIERPPQPSPHLPAERLGTARRPLRSTTAASATVLSARPASSPVTRAMAWLVSSRPSLLRVRSLAAISRTRRAAARRRSVIVVAGAPPAACTRRAVRTSLPTALASSPESVG
jgi:hypothetical protein